MMNGISPLGALLIMHCVVELLIVIAKCMPCLPYITINENISN
jgi:hypothetical protein